MTIFDLGGEKVHDTVVMNEKGCFSLGWGRVCWRDGPSSKDFLALCTHHEKIIETNGGRRKWYCECTTYFQREVHATKHEHRPRGGGERRGSSPQYFRLWIVDITHICPQYFKAQPRWHAYASSFRLNKASTLGHKCWRFNIDPLTLLQRIGITKYPKHVLISLKPFGKYKIIHVQHLLSNKHWVLIGWV